MTTRHGLTEERLAEASKEMWVKKVKEESSDDEDDDVEIVSEVQVLIHAECGRFRSLRVRLGR